MKVMRVGLVCCAVGMLIGLRRRAAARAPVGGRRSVINGRRSFAPFRDIARGRRKCIPMRAMATQTAMLKWLKIHSASRPEAPSQAEQIERPTSDDVHSTSMELEMTYLKDPPTPTENGQSPISADTSANIGMILGRILNRLSRIETELTQYAPDLYLLNRTAKGRICRCTA